MIVLNNIIIMDTRRENMKKEDKKHVKEILATTNSLYFIRCSGYTIPGAGCSARLRCDNLPIPDPQQKCCWPLQKSINRFYGERTIKSLFICLSN